jgi:hypothetical protein
MYMIYSGVDRIPPNVEQSRRSRPTESAIEPWTRGAEAHGRVPDDDRAPNSAGDTFDRLFELLRRRLRALAPEWHGGAIHFPEHANLRALHARILECAAALDHMHSAFGQDIARMGQAERELRLTKDAFARSQAELETLRSAADRRIDLEHTGP